MLLPTLLFAALAQAAPQFGGNQGFTMLRFGCAQTAIDRIDPLVNPGQAPSPHMHQIVGGNAFNITMASTDISKLADCTTCGYSEDVSEKMQNQVCGTIVLIVFVAAFQLLDCQCVLQGPQRNIQACAPDP
jgi:hypothetical protein